MPPSQPAQQWMTATSAILTTLTRRAPRHDLLGGTVKSPESTPITRTILANSWDVHDADSLRKTLTWLREEGHRKGYQASPNDGLGPRGLLAWDLCRVISVAGWGYVADYISEDEAWAHVGPAAAQLKQAYQSWEDLGWAYVKGAYAWEAAAGADCEQKYQALVADPASPWRTVPWNTDLGPIGPPPAAPPIANLAAGTLNVGGGQLRVKINGKTPENYVKGQVSQAVSQTIWGWVIGGIILLVGVLLVGGIGAYAYMSVKNPPKTAGVGKWDGKSPFTCAGNDDVSLTGVTASVSGTAITATGNCHLTLTGVNITAPVGIEANGNARVTMTGGSITATTNSVVASAAAQVSCVGTKVSGKSKASGGAKITGAN